MDNIEFLQKQINDFFSEKPEQEIAQDQIALIEENQRKLIEEEENQYLSSQEETMQSSFLEPSDDKVEECSEPLSSAKLSSDRAPITVYAFTKIDAFLKNPNQVNGALSKSVDGILKQLKDSLLKKQVDSPYEQRALQKEKAYEIHAQLILATAAVEQIMQAIQDQKWDHVVLGFRSTFIHCHFAVEQTLSLKILLESSESTITHDLVQLAKKAKLEETQKGKEFLEDIAMHLWFCYPEDYRITKKTHPKPFIYLEKLYPCKDTKQVDVNIIKEAVQLCFSRYNQTIEFISEVFLTDRENFSSFLDKVKEVQEKIQSRIGDRGSKKHHSENRGSILDKCNKALDAFHQLDGLRNLQYFEARGPLTTIKKYLQLIKISLQTSQKKIRIVCTIFFR